MDEHHLNILQLSNAEINRLQLLSVFFEEEVLYKIYLRSKVIHQLFENNPELDIDKLELFHVQFTSSLIALLKKIKKSNEKNVSLIDDEIYLNKEMIRKMSSHVYTEKNFNLDKQKQSLKINLSLRKLYQLLSDHSDEFPFSKNINTFSSRYSREFYKDITTAQLEVLLQYELKDLYIHQHASIQKKLMGLLCKYDFRTAFFYGLKAGDIVIEIYKFLDVETYFLFYPGRNLFILFDINKLEGMDWSNPISDKGRIVQELLYKNDKLTSKIAAIKTYIPEDILLLLKENYMKIDDISFLDHLNNFDVQANILKAMLKTDLF
ncbi:hypothetical protein [Pedobacter sp.]|uniref:hypothetical protein n=1 Tax=Pedobacter sp. TaxID=1411316 RepID=UPI003D7FFCF8